MVFAVWAGRRECVTPELAQPFLDSCRFGLAHLEEIVRLESRAARAFRGIRARVLRAQPLLEFGEREYRGLDLFLRYIAELNGELGASAC